MFVKVCMCHDNIRTSNLYSQNSLHVIAKAYGDSSIAGAKVYDRFQFERTGFFSVDPDSTRSKVRIISFTNDAISPDGMN